MTLSVNTLSPKKQLIFSILSTQEMAKTYTKPVIISSKIKMNFDIRPTLFSMSSNALSKFLEEETEPLF